VENKVQRAVTSFLCKQHLAAGSRPGAGGGMARTNPAAANLAGLWQKEHTLGR